MWRIGSECPASGLSSSPPYSFPTDDAQRLTNILQVQHYLTTPTAVLNTPLKLTLNILKKLWNKSAKPSANASGGAGYTTTALCVWQSKRWADRIRRIWKVRSGGGSGAVMQRCKRNTKDITGRETRARHIPGKQWSASYSFHLLSPVEQVQEAYSAARPSLHHNKRSTLFLTPGEAPGVGPTWHPMQGYPQPHSIPQWRKVREK